MNSTHTAKAAPHVVSAFEQLTLVQQQALPNCIVNAIGLLSDAVLLDKLFDDATPAERIAYGVDDRRPA